MDDAVHGCEFGQEPGCFFFIADIRCHARDPRAKMTKPFFGCCFPGLVNVSRREDEMRVQRNLSDRNCELETDCTQ